MLRRTNVRITLLILVCSSVFYFESFRAISASPAPSGVERFKAVAQQLASAPADDCGWDSQENDPHPQITHELEFKLLEAADSAVLQALSNEPQNPVTAASHQLAELEATSKDEDNRWPEKRQFHAELLDLHSLLVVNYRIRSRASFSVFGIPELLPEPGSRKNVSWRIAGTDANQGLEPVADETMNLYPLWKGPSHRARFLSLFRQTSCGDGQTSLDYRAYEWEPSSTGDLREIIHREGVVSGDMIPVPEQQSSEGPVTYLKAIGKLTTTGRRITIPYCWHSPLDDSVWAILCSVDAYDLSGDRVRFLATRDNRPDLAALAKTIKYAQARNLTAVLAYSASPQVARAMTSLIPPEEFYPSGLAVSHPTPDTEQIELSDGHVLKFLMMNRKGRWVVAQFMLDNNNPQ